MKRRDFIKANAAGTAKSAALIMDAPAIAQGKFECKQPTIFAAVPAFQEPAAAFEIVVNQDAINELPANLQAIVANAAKATSVETLAQFDYFNTQALGQLRADGVEFREFPEDVILALRKASADVMAKLAEENKGFRKVMDSYLAFLNHADEYANLMQGAMYRQRS